MSYKLILGDYAYSSWSLRGWLLFHRFGIPAKMEFVDFNSIGVAEQLKKYSPARTVPTAICEDGAILWDSLALAEEIAEREPQAGLWPEQPALRGLGRSLASEMHSGFSSLRNECPMNLRVAYSSFVPSESTKADVERLDEVWSYALEKSGGPWLCGRYSIADVFYAPVAGRIAGYGIGMSDTSQDYVARHLADPAFRRWRAMGMVRGDTLPWYARDYDTRSWPGPAAKAAKAIDEGKAENETCPYSGGSVNHLMEMDGRIFGFCNAFCRDKTVADPEAWPDFMKLV